MSKVVIFGASGFVGQYLVRSFEKNNIEYIAYSSKTLDLTDPISTQKIADNVKDGDIIIMLSALTPENGAPDELTLKNILMIKHLLAGIEKCDIAQFIYISSDAVYSLSSDIIDENTPPQPGDHYGCMHVMRERYITAKIAPEKLAIFRPCAIYGRGDRHNGYGINRFIRDAISDGEIRLFGNGEEYRDHLYIDDFVNIIFTAYQKKISGVYNVASGKSWRFSELAEHIKSRFTREITIINKPRAVPIFHRHVNLVKLWSVFSDQKPENAIIGINKLLENQDSYD